MKILGSVDRCDEQLIEGWITVSDDPKQKVVVEAVVNNEILGCSVASNYRDDLFQAGIGDGQCAFSIPTPKFLPKSQLCNVKIRMEGSAVFLGSPFSSGKSAGRDDTISQFGGLWIDRHNWIDTLAARCRAGKISEEISSAIFHFVRDGYVIFPGAVSLELVDGLNEEIDRAWVSPPDGLLAETFEPDGKLRLVTPALSYREGRTKVLDYYAFSDLARRAMASETVVAFLSAIFDDDPKAFQGLTFWNGSQQAIHKDTAYVKIDTNPMNLAATWLALEDIEPGTGELEYYIGSHRSPEYLFGGSSKWMENHPDEHERFLNSLHEDASSLGQVRGTFLAKKGDVLVWHADLAHGGSAITSPGLSRRSLVSHWTANADEPYYRRSGQNAERIEYGCSFVSQYYSV